MTLKSIIPGLDITGGDFRGTERGVINTGAVTVNGQHITVNYTGNTTGQTISTVGFQPDLVIIMANSAQSIHPQCPAFDSYIGVGMYNDLSQDNGFISDTNSITAFTANGFTLGTSTAVNLLNAVYTAHCWKKSSNFFDIAAAGPTDHINTFTHNLGAVPEHMLNSYGTTNGDGTINYNANAYSTPQKASFSTYGPANVAVDNTDTTTWDDTAPTSTYFTMGNAAGNAGIGTSVMYLWGAQSGISAFGTYTGNGSASGPSVSGLGFTPSLVMIMAQTTTGRNWQWVWGDTASLGLNMFGDAVSSTNYINLVSGGFNIVTTNADFNSNGVVYFYNAFK